VNGCILIFLTEINDFQTKDGDCKLVLSLADTTKTRKMWNFKYEESFIFE